MAKIKSDWWTTPTESENGRLIMVTGRKDMESYISSGIYTLRVEITWRYEGGSDGFPSPETTKLMGDVTDALVEYFDKNPVAIVTGIYTGDDERNIVMYCKSSRLQLFEKLFNQVLSPFPVLPISIYVEEDREWNEYKEMKDLTEISTSD